MKIEFYQKGSSNKESVTVEREISDEDLITKCFAMFCKVIPDLSSSQSSNSSSVSLHLETNVGKNVTRNQEFAVRPNNETTIEYPSSTRLIPAPRFQSKTNPVVADVDITAGIGQTTNKSDHKDTFRNPLNVGRGDLDPFSSNAPMSLPGQGMLIGPNNPVFNGEYRPNFDQKQDNSQSNFLPEGYRPPQPRFDEFGPVFGSNPDIAFQFSGDDDDPNKIDPLRKGRPGHLGGGRGGGRGRGSLFGEPNPDHFKPPGW